MSSKRRWILIVICLLVANAAAMGYLVLASATHPPQVLTNK
jgi:hypothetical protein